jgi:flagellar motility protein MotE (MotC chaperone)
MTAPVRQSARRQAGRGALVILALFLAASGALRLGAGVGTAMANASDVKAGGVADTPMDCPAPPLALAEALLARETDVSRQEAAVADRLAALALAEAALTGRLTELNAAEARLKATLALADGAAENDLARLTAVYESMKPGEAAALFSAMAPEFAAGFLGRMRPEAAAAILSGMTADTAYGISVLLAGRNALVPKQ